MKNYLNDILDHTYALGCVDLVKVSGDADKTEVNAMASDRSVVVEGSFTTPIPNFTGTFGMPNLNSLKILLNIPEYKENEEISVATQERNGETIPVGLHF
jgi:hypothetical protein